MRTETKTIIGALRVAADRMEELCAELLFQRRVAEKYTEAAKICGKIYIARNITLEWQEIPSLLKAIDKLYRDENHN